jgi:hypothetical protein
VAVVNPKKRRKRKGLATARKPKPVKKSARPKPVKKSAHRRPKPAKRVARKPSKSARKPVGKSAKKPARKPIGKPAKKVARKPVGKPAKKVARKPVGKPAKKVARKPAKKVARKPAKKVAQPSRPVRKPAKKPVKKPVKVAPKAPPPKKPAAPQPSRNKCGPSGKTIRKRLYQLKEELGKVGVPAKVRNYDYCDSTFDGEMRIPVEPWYTRDSIADQINQISELFEVYNPPYGAAQWMSVSLMLAPKSEIKREGPTRYKKFQGALRLSGRWHRVKNAYRAYLAAQTIADRVIEQGEWEIRYILVRLHWSHDGMLHRRKR